MSSRLALWGVMITTLARSAEPFEVLKCIDAGLDLVEGRTIIWTELADPRGADQYEEPVHKREVQLPFRGLHPANAGRRVITVMRMLEEMQDRGDLFILLVGPENDRAMASVGILLALVEASGDASSDEVEAVGEVAHGGMGGSICVGFAEGCKGFFHPRDDVLLIEIEQVDHR